jgi:hypothetical protein
VCSAIPDGRVAGLGGNLGLIGGETGAVEAVANYNTGEQSLFLSTGFQAGWNGGAGANAHIGFIWGLGDRNGAFSERFGGVNGSLGPVGVYAQAGGKSGPYVAGGTLGISLFGAFTAGISGT